MPGTYYRIIDSGRDRARWMAARQGGIGASEVPALFGVSRFASPLSVYAEKIGARAPYEGNPVTDFGHDFEPVLLERFGEALGRIVRPDGRMLQSRRFPWLRCTLDGRQWERSGRFLGAVEGKTALEDWSIEGLPLEVELQVQAQYAVTRFPRIDLAIFNRFSAQHGWMAVPPNWAMIYEIQRETQRFWYEHVVANVPPPVDGSDASKRAIERLYPYHAPGEVARLDDEYAALAERVEKLSAALRRGERKVQQMKNALRMAIGDAEYGQLPDGSGWACRLEHKGEYTVAAKEQRIMRRIKNVEKTITQRARKVQRAAKSEAA